MVYIKKISKKKKRDSKAVSSQWTETRPTFPPGMAPQKPLSECWARLLSTQPPAVSFHLTHGCQEGVHGAL